MFVQKTWIEGHGPVYTHNEMQERAGVSKNREKKGPKEDKRSLRPISLCMSKCFIIN